MPPEQRRDATQTDNRSDLWSLAATLYQLVTGEPPRVIDLNDVPEDLRPCLTQALKQKPDDRYQSVSEFRDALMLFPPATATTLASRLPRHLSLPRHDRSSRWSGCSVIPLVIPFLHEREEKRYHLLYETPQNVWFENCLCVRDAEVAGSNPVIPTRLTSIPIARLQSYCRERSPLGANQWTPANLSVRTTCFRV
jgi:serine/threonine protein kinase